MDIEKYVQPWKTGNMMMTLIYTLIFATLLNFFSCQTEAIRADNPDIHYIGRVSLKNGTAEFSWPGTSIHTKFEGAVCNLLISDLHNGANGDGSIATNHYNIILDGKEPFVLKMEPGKSVYKIDGLSDSIHSINIIKRTESFVGVASFKGIQLAKGKKILKSENPFRTRIQFIGNSITCGYGNEGKNQNCLFSAETENNYMAYSAITARNLNAEFHAIAFSGKGLYQNYDGSRKETLPELYDLVIPSDPDIYWNHKKWIPDFVIINLGTNDFAHVNPDSAIWVSTYISFINKIRAYYPEAKIICINGPMLNNNYPSGNKALTTIQNYINTVVKVFNTNGDTGVFSYFPSSQGGLDFGCDWHPNIKQHVKTAKELTAFLLSIKK